MLHEGSHLEVGITYVFSCQVLEVQTDGPRPFAMLAHKHLRTIDDKAIPIRIDVNNHHALLTARFVKTYVDMVSRGLAVHGVARQHRAVSGPPAKYARRTRHLHYASESTRVIVVQVLLVEQRFVAPPNKTMVV